jgi:hypothetical protein
MHSLYPTKDHSVKDRAGVIASFATLFAPLTLAVASVGHTQRLLFLHRLQFCDRPSISSTP